MGGLVDDIDVAFDGRTVEPDVTGKPPAAAPAAPRPAVLIVPLTVSLRWNDLTAGPPLMTWLMTVLASAGVAALLLHALVTTRTSPTKAPKAGFGTCLKGGTSSGAA